MYGNLQSRQKDMVTFSLGSKTCMVTFSLDTTCGTATLVCSRVLSRIDYCNSLLAGITSDQTARLQRILNNSARLSFRKKRSEHVTPKLIIITSLASHQTAHWIHTSDTGFLLLWWYFTSHTVSPRTPPTDPFDHLLTNCSVFHVLTWKAPVQTRSFQYQAPCVWNSVPIQTRFSTSSPLLNPASKHTSSAMPSPESLKLSP